MKLGTENKTKTAIAAALLVVAAFALYNWLKSNDDSASASPAATGPTTASIAEAKKPAKPSARKPGPVLLAQSLDPTLRLDLLNSSEDVSYKGAGRDIFQNQPEPAAIPKVVKPVINTGPPTPPPPPPIPLKFYGYSGNKSGPKQVFLSKGDDIFIAKEGQIVDRRYKILKIGPNSIEVEDVLTNHRQTLPLTSG
ncbi:MAG TPA: hypothetical protein VE779_01445 [Candidatus Angelobacter sp.]|nr:hypothetical protein [Candidatus Angelobacter sp.]